MSFIPFAPFVIRLRRRSLGGGGSLLILVMPFPPQTAILVATFGRAIEPLIHSPKSIHSARVSRVSVINNSVLERECAHSGTLARVSVNVGPGRRREFGRSLGSRAR